MLGKKWKDKYMFSDLLKISLTVGIIFLFGCATPKVQPTKDVQTPTKEPTEAGDSYAETLLGYMAYQKGDMAKAKEHIFKALSFDPDSSYLNFLMSVILRNENNQQDAMFYAQKAISLNPNNHDAHAQIADLYMLQKEEEKAYTHYQKAFELNPANERVALVLLSLQVRQGNYQAALNTLDTIIEHRPDFSLARYYKAKVLIDMDRLDEAERILVNLIESDADVPSAYIDLINIYEYEGRHEEEKELLRQIIQQNPNDTSIRERYINICLKLNDKRCIEEQIEYLKNRSGESINSKRLLGSIYIQTKKFQDAIDIFDSVLKEDPSDDRTRFLLGLCYESAGMINEAIDLFYSFPDESDFYSKAIYEIVRMLMKSKKYKDASILLQKNNEKLKGDPQYYIISSFLAEKIQGVKSAIDLIKEGLNQKPEDEELLYRLGILYDKAKEKDKALEIMHSILKKNKNHADALNYIGYTYADENKNLKEALNMIRKALKLKPGSGYIIDSLGWVYFRLGDMERAKRYLMKAAELEPEDPTINEHLADLYLKLGDSSKALHYYNRSIKLGNPQKERILDIIRRLKSK